MTEFLEGLDTLARTFWYISIPTTILFLLMTAMTFIGLDGGDTDVDGDVDGEVGDDGAPFQMFTLRNLINFLMVFAWTGIVCLEEGLTKGPTLFIASFAGVLMVLLMTSIFYFASKLAADGSRSLITTVGRQGTTYLTIPAFGKGRGKVKINVEGSFQVLEAESTGGEIKTGSPVRVESIVDNILRVKMIVK